MTTVTLEEARDRLPELIGLVAAGEKVVLVEGGKWIAALAAPPAVPTPEEIAVAEARREHAVRALRLLRDEAGGSSLPTVAEVERMAAQLDFIRTVVEFHEQDGNPLPADHPLQILIAKRSAG